MKPRASRWIRFAGYLLLGAIPFFIFAAPDKEKPEKITVGGITWNKFSMHYDVGVLADASLAGHAQRNGYVLVTTLEVMNSSGAVLVNLGPQRDPVQIRASSTGRGSDMVELVHPLVPWDRNGGSVTGSVDVLAAVTMVDGKGRTVAQASQLVQGIPLD